MKKVLIANRGEIACRAIRSLRKLGKASVAVYSSADVSSLHVLQADEAIHLGEAPAKLSYLALDKVFAAIERTGADGVFPGYGFLSENASFAEQCEERGVAFVGPTPEQLSAFGLKHRARQLAEAAGVPLLPGTGLLADVEQAKADAKAIGYPVMLKSTAGGGGIGLTLCNNEQQLAEQFESAIRLSENNFSQAGVFLEKFVAAARHIEVQIFGDGQGGVATLGERDCSAQRRNQKVLEETPAPGLSDETRNKLYQAAASLARSVNYRSAGTVEFIYDTQTDEFYFLEVNTRLQVEHGVTEQVSGVDLVEWMLLTAEGSPPDLSAYAHTPRGHSIEARIYAESPSRNFQPSSGLLTRVDFPNPGQDLRVDTWVETGVEVSPFYDPMIAKLMVLGKDREQALQSLDAALEQTQIHGIETNIDYLRDIARDPVFVEGRITTNHLKSKPGKARGLEVVTAGTLSAVQDAPGRVGYWNVGIPPSGAMDSLALALGNRAVGNPPGAAGIEMTMMGASVRFHQAATIALSGADMGAKLDDRPLPHLTATRVQAGQLLQLGSVQGAGVRTYLCVRGGIDVPEYLGSRATFDLGRFGGHGGRNLVSGDVLHVAAESATLQPATTIPESLYPELKHEWHLRVMYGPHGAPDFFQPEDVKTFFETAWEVHYNSARTGIRLLGPKPKWAREDGGEAGLHPSNIHDNAYAFGAVDYTGDMPIILGPDGPSLGGFVCPATVISADLWMLGQLKPGDKIHFVPVSEPSAKQAELSQQRMLDTLEPEQKTTSRIAIPERAPLAEMQPPGTPQVVYRPCGDKFLLVEYGPLVLDWNLRFRVHALMTWLTQQQPAGIIELTPGIRSLQVHYDNHLLPQSKLVDLLQEAEDQLPDSSAMRVPTRVVHLPLSWDDEATQLAIKKYTQLVRKDAPWAPSNIEFIRRINGLGSIDDVKRIVFDASYMVLGLGDVYLGAPVATPLDPRHRLVTTKYNPARTWTPENAVGIGGAYLCIYGMEGPGGYQFVGRTLQVYNRYRQTKDFVAGKPWLLRFFDQIRFFEVSSEEILDLRDAFIAGRYELKIEQQEFDLAEYNQFLQREASSIAEFKHAQQAAFEAERQRWVEQGLLNFNSPEEANSAPAEIPEGMLPVESTVPGSVWKIDVKPGDAVQPGDRLMILESMKMEMSVPCNVAGTIMRLEVSEGQAVSAGQVVALIEPES